jgi:hypothetical protein
MRRSAIALGVAVGVLVGIGSLVGGDEEQHSPLQIEASDDQSAEEFTEFADGDNGEAAEVGNQEDAYSLMVNAEKRIEIDLPVPSFEDSLAFCSAVDPFTLPEGDGAEKHEEALGLATERISYVINELGEVPQMVEAEFGYPAAAFVGTVALQTDYMDASLAWADTMNLGGLTYNDQVGGEVNEDGARVFADYEASAREIMRHLEVRELDDDFYVYAPVWDAIERQDEAGDQYACVVADTTFLRD